jgi:hypothetical protein
MDLLNEAMDEFINRMTLDDLNEEMHIWLTKGDGGLVKTITRLAVESIEEAIEYKEAEEREHR